MATTVDIRPLAKLSASVRRQCGAKGGGPLRRSLKQCAAVYRAFLQTRYVKESRGGGDWPDLAPSTIAKRRKARLKKIAGLSGAAKAAHDKKRKRQDAGDPNVAILRDTGVLFAALDSGRAPGAVEEDIPGGIRVGYGGGGRHPGGQATIADIAGFHQAGGRRLPRRMIIVPPDRSTLSHFGRIIARAMIEEIKGAGQAK